MKPIAWMPGDQPRMADALAIELAPTASLTTEVYLGLLAIRVQALVDAAARPAEVVEEFAATLAKAGYFPETAVDPSEAGATLILSNDSLLPVLRMRGVMPAEAVLDATRPVLAADLALQADRTQPATARLRRIALLLALPT